MAGRKEDDALDNPDLGLRSATELCAALAAGDLSSLELFEHYRERYERFNFISTWIIRAAVAQMDLGRIADDHPAQRVFPHGSLLLPIDLGAGFYAAICSVLSTARPHGLSAH